MKYMWYIECILLRVACTWHFVVSPVLLHKTPVLQ